MTRTNGNCDLKQTKAKDGICLCAHENEAAAACCFVVLMLPGMMEGRLEEKGGLLTTHSLLRREGEGLTDDEFFKNIFKQRKRRAEPRGGSVLVAAHSQTQKWCKTSVSPTGTIHF
jgi:hypothetical protein